MHSVEESHKRDSQVSGFKFLWIVLLLSQVGNLAAQNSGDAPSKKDYSHFKGGNIYVIPSSHQDIAWMDSIGACIKFRDERMITPVLDRLRNNPDFKYSVEDALSLREYLQGHPDAYDEILAYTREGRLEWGATYKQPYESMYDGESLIRQAYFGRKWLKKTLPGCDFKTYWNEDVPGRAMQMAQILSKSGIPFMQFSRHQPGIYRWYSPDGSYVSCFSPGQYHEVAWPISKVGSDVDGLTEVFTNLLAEWNDYYKQHGIAAELPFVYSFDFATPPDFDGFFSDWNASSGKLDKPRIQYATGDAWAEAMFQGTGQLPEIRGERPNVWLYIHGPSHHRALKASREGSRLLTAAEKFATFDALQLGSFNKYPQDKLEKAWEKAIYPDHGWGGKHGDLTDRAFRTSFEDARDMASGIVGQSVQNIASRIQFSREGIPVVVFNPLSWKRTDIVKFTLDVEGFADNRFKLVDDKGKEIAYELIDEHQVKGKRDEVISFLFVAEDVPSVGYKTYYLEKGQPADWPRTSETGISNYENQYYKAAFSEGGIKSLYDKELSVQLFKTDKFLGAELFTMQSVGNGAGEFTDVQQPTMEGFEKLSQYKQPWLLVSEGPVRDVYQFTRKINHVKVQQRIVLYKTIKRIDVEVELLGFDGEPYREFRLAFPVNQTSSEVAYEVPMGVVRVGKDEMKGAAGFSKPTQIYDTPCAEVHPREVQDWFSVSDGNNAITISSDVAVFDWLDPTTDPVKNTILQPVLLASRKSCHGLGNYFLQPGNHSFSFSLYSHRGDWKNGYRLGTQSNQALKAVTIENNSGKRENPETMSLVAVEGRNLVLSTVKKCDDDDQVIVRCYDIEGIDSDGEITFYRPFRNVELSNMIEEDGQPLQGKGNSLKLKVGHHSIETLKFDIK